MVCCFLAFHGSDLSSSEQPWTMPVYNPPMAEEQDKKDDEKIEFDSAGQAVAYISLDQARVLALQHARDN